MEEESEPRLPSAITPPSSGTEPRPTLHSAAANFAPSVDGYTIHELLGEGGMGAVWRATQLSTRRTVALKLMSRDAFSEHARRRFDREVELAARLAHPNVARVYDSGLRDGRYFYAMELIDGVPLDQYVREQNLPQRAVLDLVRLTAMAVGHAHQNGVIHRDLKPSNILVSADGQPHLLDFGLARPLDLAVASQMTIDVDVLGTPEFMSPEQAQAKPVDTRSDIYSLGATLYLLLTGKLPHETSGSRIEVIKRIAETEPLRPRRANTSVDVDLEALLLKALARNPDQRYGSMNEFAQDIANYRAGEPLSARRITATYVLRKRLRKYWQIVSLAAVVVVLMVAIAVYSFEQIARERGEAVAARRDAEFEQVKSQAQLAGSLISEGPGNNGAIARGKYTQSWEIAQKLKMSQWPSLLAILSTYQTAAPPIMGSDGVQAGVRGLEGANLSDISPDGNWGVSIRDRDLLLWDVRLGTVLRRIAQTDGSEHDPRFSTDGRQISTQSARETWVRDATSGEVFCEIAQPFNVRKYLLDDQRHYCIFVEPSRIMVWDIRQRRPVRTIPSPRGVFYRASFLGNQATLVVGELEPDFVSVWDLRSGTELRNAAAGPEIFALSASPDGKRLFTFHSDHHAVLWDATTLKQVKRIDNPDSDLLPHFFVNDSAAVAETNNGSHALLDGLTGAVQTTFASTLRPTGVYAWNQRLLAKNNAREGTGVFLIPKLDDATDQCATIERVVGNEVRSFRIHFDRATNVSVSSDGLLALSCGFDNSCTLWDIATGKVIRRFPTASHAWRAALVHNAAQVLIGEESGRVTCLDVASSRILREWTDRKGLVLGMSISPDGRRAMVSWHQEGAFWIDLENGPYLQRFSAPPLRTAYGMVNRFQGVATNRDGSSGIVMHMAGLNRVELNTGKLLRHTGAIIDGFCCVFSPDNTLIAIGTRSGDVALWNQDNDHVRIEHSHGEGVSSVVFTPDGEVLFSGSLDGTVKAWDRDLNVIRTFKMRGPVSGLAISPDGNTLLCSTRDGYVTRWEFDRPRRFAEFEQSVPKARERLKKDRNDAAALAVFGEWYAFRGVSDWSAELLEQARQGGANISNLMLARQYWQRGRNADARREFERALDRHEAPESYLRLCISAIHSPPATMQAATTAPATR